MAMEISISEQGRADLQDSIEIADTMDLAKGVAYKEFLEAVAKSDDEFNPDYENLNKIRLKRERELLSLERETLNHIALDAIDETRTMDNKGDKIYIDPEGHYSIDLTACYVHAVENAIKNIDSDLTDIDPISSGVFHDKNMTSAGLELHNNTIVFTLSDKKTQVGFNKNTRELFISPDASEEMKKEFNENIQYSKDELIESITDLLERRGIELERDYSSSYER